MPLPPQARSYHAETAATAVRGVQQIRRLFQQGAGWAPILETLAQYQLAAATSASLQMADLAGQAPQAIPERFAGSTSAGFPLYEPIVATIDQRVPAPVEDLPAPWWDDLSAFMASVEQLVESEIKDAARSAFQVELNAAPDWQNYVRVLVPPSCKRCVVLAGKIYRDLDGFERHPKCDCVHWPVQDWEEAHELGLVSSPMEAFEKGMIRDLTEAEHQAIEDGADIYQVINSSAGIYTADLFGHRAKAVMVTKRSAWRKTNPSRLVRLRPEAIYRIVRDEYDGDRGQLYRLLKLYGYMRADADIDRSGSGGSLPPRSPAPPRGDDEDDEAEKAASRLEKSARANEAEVSDRVQRVADQVGGTRERFETRFKTHDEIVGKLVRLGRDRRLIRQRERTFNDALRYTVVLGHATYWRQVGEAIAALSVDGYQVVKPRPDRLGWASAGYKGINLTVTAPNGYRFEVQLHTAASLAAAESTHAMYEERRRLAPGSRRYGALTRAMERTFQRVPVPPGVPRLD